MLMLEPGSTGERYGRIRGRPGPASDGASAARSGMATRGGLANGGGQSTGTAPTTKRRRLGSLTRLKLPAEAMETPPNSAPSSPISSPSALAPRQSYSNCDRFGSALIFVAGHLDLDELCQLMATCRQWRAAIGSTAHLWRRIIIPMRLAHRVTDGDLVRFLSHCENAPAELDLRGCIHITASALAPLESCRSLRRLDVRGTKARPAPAVLHSLSPVTTAIAAGATVQPLRRLSAMHLGSCSEQWHGAVGSKAEWSQLLRRLSGDKTAAAAVAATATLIDWDTDMVLFASQLGSFAGSMWPKPQSRIVVAVGQCDGDLVAQVTVPAVVENAGWFDAVVVPRVDGHVRWFFDAAAAKGERALCFEPVQSLDVDSGPTAPRDLITGCREPAAQLDAFLHWASSAGHGRSARHLINGLAQGRLALEDIAADLPKTVRSQLARELWFRTGSSTPTNTRTSRRRPAATTPPDVTPPRSPDLEAAATAATVAGNVDADDGAAAMEEEAEDVLVQKSTPSPSPVRTPIAQSKPCRPGAILTPHVLQRSPLSQPSCDASSIGCPEVVNADLLCYLSESETVGPVELDDLIDFCGDYFKEAGHDDVMDVVAAASPTDAGRVMETSPLETGDRSDRTPSPPTPTTAAATSRSIEFGTTSRPKRRRFVLVGEAHTPELDMTTAFKATERSSVVIIGSQKGEEYF
mmetsp:Transcript_31383/g.82285  ORF Transcript_31383/g.82285 Transcript_31383/m.82285 type:complete len:693 (-) Transcript_31383:778-2856(-)